MDAKELKAACIAAGGQLHKVRVQFPEHGNWSHSLHDPTLPAYVAELLIQKSQITEYTVSEMDVRRVPYAWECEALTGDLEKVSGTGDTQTEAIIRAAMSVLTE